MVTTKTNFINRVAIVLAGLMLVLLPFHAFFYTWIKSFFWTDDWTIIVHIWKEIVIGILCLLGLWQLLRKRQGLPKDAGLLKHANLLRGASLPRGKGNSLAYIYLGLTLLHLAIFPGDSIFQAIFGWRNAAIFIVLFLVIQIFSWSGRALHNTLIVMLIAGCMTAMFGILQVSILPPDFLTHFGYSKVISTWDPHGNLPAYHQLGDDASTIRAQSTFSQPNRFGAYLLLLFFPLLFFSTSAKGMQKTHRVIAGLAGIIVMLALFFTYSRGAWISLAITLAYLAWQKYRRRASRRYIIVGIVALAIAGITIALNTQTSTKLQEMLLRSGSSSAHIQRSIQAIDIGLRHPLGIGLGSTGGVSMRFDPEGKGLGTENFYLQILVEQGYLGFLAFLVFIIYLTHYLLRHPEKTYYLGYSLLALALANLFTETFDDTAVALSAFAIIGVAWQIKQQLRGTTRHS